MTILTRLKRGFNQAQEENAICRAVRGDKEHVKVDVVYLHDSIHERLTQICNIKRKKEDGTVIHWGDCKRRWENEKMAEWLQSLDETPNIEQLSEKAKEFKDQATQDEELQQEMSGLRARLEQVSKFTLNELSHEVRCPWQRSNYRLVTMP